MLNRSHVRNIALRCQIILFIVFLAAPLIVPVRALNASPRRSDPTASAPPSKQDMQTQINELEGAIDKLERAKALTIKHIDEKGRRILVNMDPAAQDLFNFQLGWLMGRTQDFEKLEKTIDELAMSIQSGHGVFTISKAQEVYKQVKEWPTLRLLRIDTTKLEIPKSKKDFDGLVGRAKKIFEEVRKIGEDGKIAIQSNARLGRSIIDQEKDFVTLAAQKKQLENKKAELAKLKNQATIARETLSRPAAGSTPSRNGLPAQGEAASGTQFDPSLLSSQEREAWLRNQLIIARETLGLDPIMWDEWHDKGDRAFKNTAEENLFYKSYPELQRYRDIARYMSPATEVDQDIANGTLSRKPTASQDLLRQAQQHLEDLQKRAKQLKEELEREKAELKREQDEDALDRASANTPNGRVRRKIKIPIPSAWVPCQCPASHPGAGIVDENGTQWHTPLLHCPQL